MEALVGLGDPRAAESIRSLLKDEQPVVRTSAQDALTTFGAPIDQ